MANEMKGLFVRVEVCAEHWETMVVVGSEPIHGDNTKLPCFVTHCPRQAEFRAVVLVVSGMIE